MTTATADQATGNREPLDRTPLYIGGKWVASEGPGRAEVINPTTEQVIATIAEGTAGDVDRAVQAAGAALPAWAALSGAERAGYLQKTSQALAARHEELALLLSQDVGTPLGFAKDVQIGLPIFNFANFAELARTFAFEGPEVGNSLIVREPAGVVGCITPWNFPLHQAVLKVAAARGRVHRRAKATGRHTAHHLGVGGGLPRDRSAARRLQSRQRTRHDCRRGDRCSPRCRHGVLHWLDVRWQAGCRGGDGDHQAGGTGARRQVRQRGS